MSIVEGEANLIFFSSTSLFLIFSPKITPKWRDMILVSLGREYLPTKFSQIFHQSKQLKKSVSFIYFPYCFHPSKTGTNTSYIWGLAINIWLFNNYIIFFLQWHTLNSQYVWDVAMCATLILNNCAT